MIAVVLAERSAEAAGLVRAVLERERDVAVVAEASDPQRIVPSIRKHRADVLLLGGGSPDEIERLIERVMREAPVSIIVLCDGSPARDRIRGALRAGAVDLVRRPDGAAPPAARSRRIAELVRAIRSAAVLARPRPTPRRARAPRQPLAGAIVAIGASTGGPPVLARILGALGRDFPAPVVVVQHMLDDFLDQFVAWIATTTRLPIEVAREGAVLAPGRVYVAPPGAHLQIVGNATAHLVEGPPVAGLRPSADVLFESLARCRLARRIGVILTGMGSDGAAGLLALRTSGGHALAQDAASCAVYGMPRAAVERGAVDEVLPPDLLAERLVALVGVSPEDGSADARLDR